MLQQILKDMYIDPNVLTALNDEQKKTLFLKMREEQVRRWKEREEKLEREGRDAESNSLKPKKANSKTVSWLLGRDGDVLVNVIGEVDELTAKFISTQLGDKKSPNLLNSTCHQTILKSKTIPEGVTAERKNLSQKPQHEISLNLKEKCEEKVLPLAVSVSEHTANTAKEKLDSKSASANEENSDPQSSICSEPPMRTSPVNDKPASANATPGCVNMRPGLTNLRLATSATSSSFSSAVKIDSGSTSPTKGGLCSEEPQKLQESQGGKVVGIPETSQTSAPVEAGATGKAAICSGRGRVAQLMKNFSVDSTTQNPPRGIKPPLPTKPNHLRLATTSTVR